MIEIILLIIILTISIVHFVMIWAIGKILDQINGKINVQD
jgi:fructose-specific phosphotransferase system IIC component|tara:strand:- start:169 stop:288 length:120 start_codon:yes stop_codon:yes gene_type:complete